MEHTAIRDFLAFNVYFIILFFLVCLMFLRPPRRVILASLLGGLLMALLNMGFDLLAYYAHWWQYHLDGLLLHLPLPFYLSPWLIYGALIYLLIWRFWRGRYHWLALLFLIGTPLFGMVRDLYGALTHTSYTEMENVSLASIGTIVMWVVMFYVGLLLFKWLVPARQEFVTQPPSDTPANVEEQANSVQ
jgi:hypothetical protein